MAFPTDPAALLARVDALRAEVDALRPLPDDQVGRAMQRLRLEWTYHSNAIEGNSLTYGETRALLMHGVTAHGKPLKDHLDIRRHREVIDYLEAFVRSDEPLTLAALREMHRLLMGDAYEVSAETADGERVKRTVRGGEFKALSNNVVTATGETHYYASPEETPALMTDLIDGLRAVDDAHPVVRAALFHHRFVEVHPFPDGNGRTARVLMNLLLMRAGYVPAVIRQEERPAYYGALSEADDGGDTDPIVAFIASELAETMTLYLRALKGEPDLAAFDRRATLLTKEVRGAAVKGPEANERLRLAQMFVLPLGVESRRRIELIKPMFGRINHLVQMRTPEGSTRVGADALGFVTAGNWLSVSETWTLKRLLSNPSVSITVRYTIRFDEKGIGVKASPLTGEAPALSIETATERTALSVADSIFGAVLSAIERKARLG